MLGASSTKEAKWVSRRPSNIALIKYMGKVKGEQKPGNSSISWTLPHLYSEVELTHLPGALEDQWQSLPSDYPIELSAKGKEKFLGHLQRLKTMWSVEGRFLVRSRNNFPSDCGIASSASSFAALTDVCVQAFSDLTQRPRPSLLEVAQLSAKGSGSSCRSFHEGWVVWRQDEIQNVSSHYSDLDHMVVLVGSGVKAVSSSEAHQRIQSSLLNRDRSTRAEARLSHFIQHLKSAQTPSVTSSSTWAQLFELAWVDSWDMHALFETSHPPFGYFQPGSIDVLMRGRQWWGAHHDGPLLTMDAGPNVHLLWRPDQRQEALSFFRQHLQGHWSVLSNLQEIGFAQV